MAGTGPRLLLVGGGRMGGALLRGWLDKAIAAPGAVTVVEPSDQAREALAPLGVDLVADAGPVLAGGEAFDLVLLALKPQVMDDAAVYRPIAEAGTVVLSIAAGKTTAYFRSILGDGAAVVRAMPNTPAQVGRGITALYATGAVDDAGRTLAAALMEAVGEVVWIEDEALMDAVTAVSGSGPAYLFHLIECLETAAREAGLADDLARRLARATVIGAAELAHRSPESAARLREEVTSPGGTTAAALEVLMGADGLEAMMVRAVAAAARRSRELAD
ncbi:MAG: pyrroline-5-carboxylate reductase [Alphaproteobacteria bacterium]|nr:pyrroline-5-carboxylate reductase [Alphaproteobacteria bacterium]